MLRQLSAIALSILMIHAADCLTPALAGSREDKQAVRENEVKAGSSSSALDPTPASLSSCATIISSRVSTPKRRATHLF